MRAPAFWWRPPDRPGILAIALSPLSAIWRIATRRRMTRPASTVNGLKVICVGNLTAGGAGKTPVVCEIIQRLQSLGAEPVVLSRGYRGSEPGPLQVDPTLHDASQVGDEPLLLANYAPVWVSRDRVAGARAAQAAGARLLVMDDGFQNPDLHKDLSLLVIDAETGFGNGRTIPAGPLREPITDGLPRADLLVAIGQSAEIASLPSRWLDLAGKDLVAASLKPMQSGMSWQGQRCVAFAGIGRPEKFFASLKASGAQLAATRSFPDHAQYNSKIIGRLRAEAQKLNAQLVTTEKDLVRLPARDRQGILPFPVRLEIQNAAPLEAALEHLAGSQGQDRSPDQH